MRFKRLAPLLLLCCALSGSSPLRAQDTYREVQPSFLHAAGGVLALNALAWSYNRYVQRWPWANVGTRSWLENLRGGFVWDDDVFMDNQLAHPYHGSLYFNAARASGYRFWQSIPYVVVGSMSWELFTENVRPSLNDFINTTLGGIALGEVTYRLSSLLTSRSGAGHNGIGRVVGAFALSPIARTQGLLYPRGHSPEVVGGSGRLAVGRRRTSDVPGTSVDHTFIELAFHLGSPFEAVRPFDAFDFRFQLSPEMPGVVTYLGVSGLLARWDLGGSRRSRSVLALFQHYDYTDLPILKIGGQSVSGAVLHRWQVGSRNDFEVGFHLEGLLLGGISSDYGHYWRRDYDYGTGAGSRFTVSLGRDNRDLIRLDGRLLWLHSLYGSEGDHLATFARVSAVLPLSGFLGVGGDFGIVTRRSWYEGMPSVFRRAPQVRAYLLWEPS